MSWSKDNTFILPFPVLFLAKPFLSAYCTIQYYGTLVLRSIFTYKYTKAIPYTCSQNAQTHIGNVSHIVLHLSCTLKCKYQKVHREVVSSSPSCSCSEYGVLENRLQLLPGFVHFLSLSFSWPGRSNSWATAGLLFVPGVRAVKTQGCSYTWLIKCITRAGYTTTPRKPHIVHRWVTR